MARGQGLSWVGIDDDKVAGGRQAGPKNVTGQCHCLSCESCPSSTLPIVSQYCMHSCRCSLATCHLDPGSGAGAGTVKCIWTVAYHIISLAPGTNSNVYRNLCCSCPHPRKQSIRQEMRNRARTLRSQIGAPIRTSACIASYRVASRQRAACRELCDSPNHRDGGDIPNAPPGEPKKRPELLLRWSDCERLAHDCRPSPRRTTAELMAAQREGFVGGICGLKIGEEGKGCSEFECL